LAIENKNPVNPIKLKKDLIRKFICILFTCTALLVFVFVIPAAIKYSGAMFSLPILTLLLSVFINLNLYLDSKGKHPIGRTILWGVFVGVNSILIIMAFYLFFQYQVIASDGTAFWALLFVPCLYIGLPSIIVGALTGLVIGLKSYTRKQSKQSFA
jgi:hypothetical protein